MQEREVIPMENILGWIPPDPHLAPIMRVFQTTGRKTLLDFKARFLNYKARDSLVPGINWIRQSRDQTDLFNDDRSLELSWGKGTATKVFPYDCHAELSWITPALRSLDLRSLKLLQEKENSGLGHVQDPTQILQARNQFQQQNLKLEVHLCNNWSISTCCTTEPLPAIPLTGGCLSIQ